MTAEIINLRRVRKARARAEEKAKAAENRAKHGRRRSDLERESALDEQREARLDGHLRIVLFPSATEPERAAPATEGDVGAVAAVDDDDVFGPSNAS
jgi:hypothetical protein